MSTLLNSLKESEIQYAQWRPYGEKLIALHERGASIAEVCDMVQSSNPHQTIALAARNVLLFLEGDRHSLVEGWERLQTASHLSKIDLEARFAASESITSVEMADLLTNAAEVKKYGSKAAHIWMQLRDTKQGLALGFNIACVSRVFEVILSCLKDPSILLAKDFASLDLETRKIFIIQAKKDSSSIPNDFVPWVKVLPKSPEISDFHVWPLQQVSVMT